ncbi:MAG: ATP-dependent DNA helicase RecG [Syntrophomonadaceae bacterium]|mgnify:CR=1 FL=1|nr:ATP-dependent DNA helicase RecG [Syntrophomonadaceae bacterium]
MDVLRREVQFLKGVGPRRSAFLKRVGVSTVFDLLWYIPRSYYSRNQVQNIAELEDGQNCQVKGTVTAASLKRSRRGMSILQVLLRDSTGVATAVWFNQPFLLDHMKKGQEIWIKGKVKAAYSWVEIHVQEYDLMDQDSINRPVIPVYALTEGLTQKALRRLMETVLSEYLPHYPELLGEEMARRFELVDIHQAFLNIHFPADRTAYQKARRRLACEELLLFNLGLKQFKASHQTQRGYIHREQDQLVEQVKQQLPFQLTAAQQRVCREIFADMEAARPMNRLLQGDVGAGKTAVAALAVAKAISSGFQAAMMAPTEILAQQHFNSMTRFFHGLNRSLALLTGSTGKAQRQEILTAASNGEIDLLVGTHALIQEQVRFAALGLVVVDEQHRFGVRQRALLGDKGISPDILVMSATPIPRTLALTVYGDLDLSIIDALPPGRKPVQTVFLKREQRFKAYNFMAKQLATGAQCYVVCPLIEESEKQDLLAAATLYEELRDRLAPGFKVGLLHGKMKAAEKAAIMDSFKGGSIQVLVSTTVIEVGVDVPNASIMIIEQAERFGLSQLHQLRGRVGRGERASICFLIGDPKSPEALRRMYLMTRIHDGYRLAQADLSLRGAGDFWGVRQHGLHQLRVADLARDSDIVELSQKLAQGFAGLNPWQQDYFNMKFKKSPHIAAN